MPIIFDNLYKLKTKEDYADIHKIIGTSCLIHYIYRYFCLLYYGDMKFKYDSFTPIIISLHGVLSISSLFFHVPKNRHKNMPMIYKEFRLHSIVFALRSIICALLFYYQFHIIYNILIINVTMISADIITYYLKADTQTMRGMPFGEKIAIDNQKDIIRMQSSQQIGATLFMMVNINSAFSPAFAIQIAAFLMTLVRKSIINELDWHRIYNISLWINIFVYNSFDHIIKMIYVILSMKIFQYLRFSLKINKYIIWNIILPFYILIKDMKSDSDIFNVFRYIVIIYHTIVWIKKTKDLWCLS